MKNNRYLMYFIAFFEGLIFYGAYATIFRTERGLQLSEIFFLESIFVILMMVLEVPWGIIGDKIGYRKTLIISYGLFLLSKVAFYYAHSFGGFLVEAILGAIAISGISGCDSAILYTSIDKKDSEKVFGKYAAFGTAGLLLSSLVSGVIAEVSLDLLAFFTIFPYLIGFILSFFLVENKIIYDMEEKTQSIKECVKQGFGNKKILIFIMAMAIIGETTHSICVFLNQPLYIRGGIGLKWFGVLLALMQLATFLSIKAYKIKKILGRDKTYMVAIGIILLSNFLLVFITKGSIVILLIFIIEGVFAITQPITETLKNESVTTQNRATILSSYAMIGNVVSAFCNMIIGLSASVSLKSALICCVAFNIIAMIAIYFLLRVNNFKQ